MNRRNDTSTAARVAAGNLRVDAATAEVLSAFEPAGVESLLLKGASVTRWISTPEDPRPYLDCDLLVRPADRGAAERVLAELGYEQLFEEEAMPEWWREHSATWTRVADGSKVDLHRSLVGIGADPDAVWSTLSARTEELVVGGYPATVLTVPGRAFHLAVHAGQHGAGWSRPLEDLDRAIAVSDEASWREAAELADSLDATAAFAAGLRLSPAGERMADRLGLPRDLPVDVALRAGTPPPVALGLDQLAQAKGPRARLRILRHKLAPPPSFMRHWSPLARRGRFGLVLAYLWRPLWLLARLPEGFRAWRRARTQARRSGSG